MKSGHPALDPILISEDGVLSLREDKISAPQPLCTLLYRHRYVVYTLHFSGYQLKEDVFPFISLLSYLVCVLLLLSAII